MARAAAQTRTPQPVDTVLVKAMEYKRLKDQLTDLDNQAKKIRDELLALTMEQGYEDENGHLWFDLPGEVDGKTKLHVQRAVSRGYDEEATRDLLEERDADDLYDTVKVPNQERVFGALEDGRLTAEDVEAMFPPKISNRFFLK